MARRFITRRVGWLALGLTVLAVLSGCLPSNNVTFTNVSDSWLNVRFFVGYEGSNELVSEHRFQVAPGETARFRVRGQSNMLDTPPPLIHMQVETVTPSWEPPGNQHWLELLTLGPVNIVAGSRGGKIGFESGSGEVARIPSRQLKYRFKYKIAGVPDTDE